MGLICLEYLHKKKINSTFNGVFNFIKSCSIGDVLTIYYFILFGKKKKNFIFTGILLSKRKNSFELENCVDSEVIKVSFSYFSPNIVDIFKSNKYNFKFNHYKFSLKEKLSLVVPNPNFISDFSNVGFDTPRLILNNFFGFFKVNFLFKKKFKKIKKKFRY